MAFIFMNQIIIQRKIKKQIVSVSKKMYRKLKENKRDLEGNGTQLKEALLKSAKIEMGSKKDIEWERNHRFRKMGEMWTM